MRISGPILVAAAAAAFLLLPGTGCIAEKGKTVPAMRQSYLDEITRRNADLTVTLAVARNNGMGSRLSVENHGRRRVSIKPEMVVIALNDSLSTAAAGDYSGYMYFRLRSAKNVCDKVDNFHDCRDKVTRYFMPFIKEEPFRFGTIRPGERRSGAIAFDRLDPYSTPKETKTFIKRLNGQEETFPVRISVKVAAKDTVFTFTAPLHASVVREPPFTALGLFYFFP